MLEWYLKVVRDNYANFSGRARRSEYWYFRLVSFLIALLLILLMFAIGSPAVYILVIYSLATIVPSLAVTVRRLHDVGKSGTYIFMSLVPIVGGILVLIALFTEGTYGPNQYGPDPKNPEQNEFDQIGTPQDY